MYELIKLAIEPHGFAHEANSGGGAETNESFRQSSTSVPDFGCLNDDLLGYEPFVSAELCDAMLQLAEMLETEPAAA